MAGLVTVTTPASRTRLSSVANGRIEIGVSDASQDAWLGAAIDRASGIIARYTGRVWGVEAVSEVFRFGWEPGVGPASQTVAPYGTPLNIQRRPLTLSRIPVLSSPVVAVTENGTALTLGTDFEIDAAAGLAYRLRGGNRGWWGVPTITVAYSAGYVLPEDPSPTLPAEVEGVCLTLVRQAWDMKSRGARVVMDQAEGVGQVRYADRGTDAAMMLDAGLQAILAPFRAPVW